MLRMRARSWTMRDAFADVLRGLHLREEIEDYVGTRSPRSAPPRPERRSFESLRPSPSPRPRRPAGAGAIGRVNGGTAIAAEPLDRNDRDRPVGGSSPANRAGETYHLVDADGVVIEVTGLDTLRARFEEIVCDKHLSPAQVTGVWESNESARQTIARLFGAEALAEVEAQLRATQELKNPPPDHGHSAPEPMAAGAVPSDELAPDQLAEPQRELGLEINPIWGIQKIFQQYRAALNALSKDTMWSKPMVARLREANIGVEHRLRAQLPTHMKQIDAVYQRAGLDA
jgi:hypothetical protein